MRKFIIIAIICLAYSLTLIRGTYSYIHATLPTSTPDSRGSLGTFRYYYNMYYQSWPELVTNLSNLHNKLDNPQESLYLVGLVDGNSYSRMHTMGAVSSYIQNTVDVKNPYFGLFGAAEYAMAVEIDVISKAIRSQSYDKQDIDQRILTLVNDIEVINEIILDAPMQGNNLIEGETTLQKLANSCPRLKNIRIRQELAYILHPCRN